MNAHFLIMCFRIFILTKGKTLSPTPSSLGEGNFPMRSGRNAETSSACQSLHKLSNELVILSEKPLDCNKSAELERRISNFSRSVKPSPYPSPKGEGIILYSSLSSNLRNGTSGYHPLKYRLLKPLRGYPPPFFKL